nr:carotenoid 9,10(9',10')-cleavage dioxygenase 1-like [Ipomoea batatas]
MPLLRIICSLRLTYLPFRLWGVGMSMEVGLGHLLAMLRFIKYDSKEFARIGVMPRHGDADSVTWFEVEPCVVFHILNCYEEDNEANFAPVEERKKAITVNNIQGIIPHDFPEGVYLRNGANPIFGGLKIAESIFGKSSQLWVEGEGMIHALYFNKDSNGHWTISYNNKHIQTGTFQAEKHRKRPAFLPTAEGDLLAVLSAILLNSVSILLFFRK